MADEEGAASPPKGGCAGAVSCQFKGKGPIVEGLWLTFEPGDANKGTLTFREKDADGDVLRTAEMEGCAVSPPGPGGLAGPREEAEAEVALPFA